MAGEPHVDVMPRARETYAGFLSMLKMSIVPIVLIVALVVWLIA